MSRIALRFSDTILTDLTFDSEAENQKFFQCSKLYPVEFTVNSERGTLKNGRNYRHILYYTKELNLAIASNELSDENIEFLQEFWSSNYIYYSLKTSSVTYSNYVKCITGSDKFPISYKDDIIYFPEINIKLINQ